jgi:hypothetical protein
MKTLLLTALVPLSFSSFAAPSAPEGELLLQALPGDYKVASRQAQGALRMTEMIPSTQELGTWKEMLTIQVFLGGIPNATPEIFLARMGDMWKKSCDNAVVELLHRGQENGYPVAFGMLTCPLNKAVGQPEITGIKAIQGKDSFYVVQKAWRMKPTPEDVKNWTGYLARVRVCDTRIRETGCPGLAAPASAPTVSATKSVVATMQLAAAPIAKPMRVWRAHLDARECLKLASDLDAMRCAEVNFR